MFSPPARNASDQDALWQALALGDLQVISSDHAPYAFNKTGKLMGGKKANFKQIPTACPATRPSADGVQRDGVERTLRPEQVRRVDLDQSGEDLRPLSEEGHDRDRSDADIAIWDPKKSVTFTTRP